MVFGTCNPAGLLVVASVFGTLAAGWVSPKTKHKNKQRR